MSIHKMSFAQMERKKSEVSVNQGSLEDNSMS